MCEYFLCSLSAYCHVLGEVDVDKNAEQLALIWMNPEEGDTV
jgi:hypothetical protein